MTEETPKKTFKGSCHCKAVTYTIDIAVPLEVSRCNCTVCTKTSWTSLRTDKSNFKLLTPASLDELPNYQPNIKTVNRHRCPTCGVHVVAYGVYEFSGKPFDFFSLNAATLDQPQEGLDLTTAKVTYYNGLDNAWLDGPKDQPWHSAFV
jgi:hypothetical protein